MVDLMRRDALSVAKHLRGDEIMMQLSLRYERADHLPGDAGEAKP